MHGERTRHDSHALTRMQARPRTVSLACADAHVDKTQNRITRTRSRACRPNQEPYHSHALTRVLQSSMAVVIRMRRTGRKNRPCYRINVADTRFPRDGRMIENLGLYDPIRRDEEAQITLDIERARYWLSTGAKPTETVASIFRRRGVFEPKPIKKRERPGRKKTTATAASREKVQTERAERKLARQAARKKEKRAAAAAAAAAAKPATPA